MSEILQKKALAEVLQVSVPGLRNWMREGAPLNADLAGDPIAIIKWYLSRPCWSLQWTVLWRFDHYPEIARRLIRERKAAKAQ